MPLDERASMPVCQGCGKPFRTKPYLVATAKHCSVKCRRTRPVDTRFWSKVQKGSVDQCWPWTARCNSQGYGTITVKKRSVRSHRLAYELFFGRSIAPGFVVCHRCDNPSCCNPNHLFAASQLDNVRDRDLKGRHRALKGSKNGIAKLTEWKVAEIKRLLAAGEKCPAIARKFEVSSSTISLIQKGRSWAHVSGAV